MRILLNVIQLLPALFAGVKSIEEAVPVPNQGSAKADFILGLVGDLVTDYAEMAPAIQKAVARIVSLFKATGVFK